MKYEFKPSFDRSVKSLPPETKQEVKELCISLIDILSGEQELLVFDTSPISLIFFSRLNMGI